MPTRTTADLAMALRVRAQQMIGQGLNALDLLHAADEMDRLNECGSDGEIASLKSFIGGRIDALNTNLNQLKDIITMSLQPEVQALLDAVAAQGVQITASNTEMVALEVSLATLTAVVPPPGAPVDAEDLAAIVAATATVVASVATLKAAMPVPVADPVVTAAAAA